MRDPGQVALAVAAALGVWEQPGVSAQEALAQVLARQQLLLLDNCEHVIDAAAQLCAGLLAACDDLRVLTTSREPLRVAGEARYRLGPLTLPTPDDMADAAGSEAVALFADRARQADAHFALDRENGPAVARLVSRLDGMPLAIELAAARVEAVGVPQLLDRLDDRFALLIAGDRLAAGRQRSLAATVAWSYELLADHERRVFRALSVFLGPFTLEAAEAVAGEGAGPAVLRLVDCSLVTPPRPCPDGRARYVLLETLRAYGARLLAEAGEDSQAAAALAVYALRVAEQAAAELKTGAGEQGAARWLDAEDAMMRQVLAWAMDHDAPAALRLAVALAMWWRQRGRLPGQYPALRAAAGHAEPGSDEWCAAQYWLGWAAVLSADLAGALGHFTAARDALQRQGPSRALADALAGRSTTLLNMGQLTEGTEDGRRSLALARQLGYPAGEAIALGMLAVAAWYDGDAGRTAQLTRQQEQITADLPDTILRAGSTVTVRALAEIGDLAAAETICAAMLARCQDVGDLDNQPDLLASMADLDMRAGRLHDAAAHLREALQIVIRTSNWFDALNGLWCSGLLCAATGRHVETVTVWAALASFSRDQASTLTPGELRRQDEALSKARQALGPDRARAAEERGSAMTMATAADYALMLTAPRTAPATAAPQLGKLSARERELVILVAQGSTDTQIAAQLHISVRTVRSHLDRIRRKTGCRRRADLTRLALNAELL